ncbi:uncharacterized protein [Rutidosis leptorrhynchoides]|uniref:uncharacterized protein isoform X3 n=1 Tax=Rutidosis leptorrhynchoides TaxID=125765 RepID=UPI003A991A34
MTAKTGAYRWMAHELLKFHQNPKLLSLCAHLHVLMSCLQMLQSPKLYPSCQLMSIEYAGPSHLMILAATANEAINRPTVPSQ